MGAISGYAAADRSSTSTSTSSHWHKLEIVVLVVLRLTRKCLCTGTRICWHVTGTLSLSLRVCHGAQALSSRADVVDPDLAQWSSGWPGRRRRRPPGDRIGEGPGSVSQ
eukprot:2193784-Rhodomonas_salina.2